MIQANELRLGNLVIDITTKKAIYIDASFMIAFLEEIRLFEPIPLTPELLEKCEFEIKAFDDTIALAMDIDSHGSLNVDNPKNVVAIKGKVFLHVIKDKLVFIYGQEHLTTGTEIQYLHQLQNLYFALTGEELTIDLGHQNNLPI